MHMKSWGWVMDSNQPLDESYFVWLYSQVADPEITDPSLTYWKLLKHLFTKEFVWRIPNDENRAEDGKALRSEFIQDLSIDDIDQDWMDMGCSMLELMIGLGRRLAFEDDSEPHYWFWRLVQNLKLDRYRDDVRLLKKPVDTILERVIFRKYESDGKGGFFPLKNPDEDQRNVELWYQLSAYVLEQS